MRRLFFFSAVCWRENQLCSFPVCFSSCKRGSPQTPPLTTRVSNMAACQFLFRIQIFSLFFLCLGLFSLYTTSASSIRGVALTSKYFLLNLNVYRGDLRLQIWFIVVKKFPGLDRSCRVLLYFVFGNNDII